MTAPTTERAALNAEDSDLTRAALEVHRRGAVPLALVPGEKRPNRDEWQRVTYADERSVVREFTSMIEGAGLGVRLGGGLADVDLDDDLARRAAPLLLPATPMRSGRESSPASHWWYRLADGSEHYVAHAGPGGEMLVEVRSDGGHQTAIPPTVHPSGEVTRWEGDGEAWEPAEVPAADVLAGAASVALVAVLARVWPSEGSRHDAYLALVGALLRGAHDVPVMVEQTSRVVDALARLTGDRDGSRARVAESVPTTVRRLADGGEVTGWPTLAGLLSADDAARVVTAAQRAADALRDALGVVVVGREVVVEDSTGDPLDPAQAEEFWTARPMLSAVREFARARRVGPWALLGAVLARAAASVPPTVVLPPTRGAVASLNLYVGLCGGSGSGKSAATEAAREFLAVNGGTDFLETSPGSGEGLTAAYCYIKPEKGRPPEIVQHRTSVLLDVDEVGALGALSARNGSTLLAVLKTAWTGKPLGNQNADHARLRRVDAHRYRLAVLCGVQPAHAGAILDDEAGGFPQRWLWMPTYDPDLVPYEEEVSEPEPWSWTMPAPSITVDATGSLVWTARRMLTLPGEAVAAILAAAQAHNRPIGAPAPGDALDGHALLTRAKVAALLALLDGRADVIDADDWHLAGVVMAVSAATRGAVIRARAVDAARSNEARGRAEGQRQAVAVEEMDRAAVARVSRKVLDRLGSAGPEGMTRADLRRSMTSGQRGHLNAALEALGVAGQVTSQTVEHRGQTGTRYRAVGGGSS